MGLEVWPKTPQRRVGDTIHCGSGSLGHNIWYGPSIKQHFSAKLLGGISRKALILGREAIDRELGKMPDMLQRGRFVPFIDHNVPPDVSWEDFEYYRTTLSGIIDTCATV